MVPRGVSISVLATLLADRLCGRHPRRFRHQLAQPPAPDLPAALRMNVPGAHVPDAVVVAAGTKSLGRLSTIHEPHMRIVVTCRQNFRRVSIVLLIVSLVRHIHLAGVIIHVDAMDFGKFQQVALGIFSQIEQGLGAFIAQFFFLLVRPGALPVPSWPPLRPEGAVAKTRRLDQGDRCSAFRQIVCRL